MPEGRHVAIIGAGAVGVISAIEALREGHRVTLIDAGEPGGEQAASYGNAGWLSSHSVIPPAEPGVWKKVPGYLMDPLGPLAIRLTDNGLQSLLQRSELIAHLTENFLRRST